MNPESHRPLDVRREGPDGVEIAHTEDVTYSDTNLGIELVIGDG